MWLWLRTFKLCVLWSLLPSESLLELEFCRFTPCFLSCIRVYEEAAWGWASPFCFGFRRSSNSWLPLPTCCGKGTSLNEVGEGIDDTSPSSPLTLCTGAPSGSWGPITGRSVPSGWSLRIIFRKAAALRFRSNCSCFSRAAAAIFSRAAAANLSFNRSSAHLALSAVPFFSLPLPFSSTVVVFVTTGCCTGAALSVRSIISGSLFWSFSSLITFSSDFFSSTFALSLSLSWPSSSSELSSTGKALRFSSNKASDSFGFFIEKHTGAGLGLGLQFSCRLSSLLLSELSWLSSPAVAMIFISWLDSSTSVFPEVLPTEATDATTAGASNFS